MHTDHTTTDHTATDHTTTDRTTTDHTATSRLDRAARVVLPALAALVAVAALVALVVTTPTRHDVSELAYEARTDLETSLAHYLVDLVRDLDDGEGRTVTGVLMRELADLTDDSRDLWETPAEVLHEVGAALDLR